LPQQQWLHLGTQSTHTHTTMPNVQLAATLLGPVAYIGWSRPNHTPGRQKHPNPSQQTNYAKFATLQIAAGSGITALQVGTLNTACCAAEGLWLLQLTQPWVNCPAPEAPHSCRRCLPCSWASARGGSSSLHWLSNSHQDNTLHRIPEAARWSELTGDLLLQLINIPEHHQATNKSSQDANREQHQSAVNAQNLLTQQSAGHAA